MLKHPTIDKLHALRLNGVAAALAQQNNNPDIEALGFEERLGLLVEREASERESKQTPGVIVVVASELSYQEESEVQVEGETNVFC